MNTNIPFAPSANTGQFAVAVTPSDTVNQPVAFRSLWLGGAGNVNVVFADGTNFIFIGALAGTFPYGGIRVNATGTTATNIGAVY